MVSTNVFITNLYYLNMTLSSQVIDFKGSNLYIKKENKITHNPVSEYQSISQYGYEPTQKVLYKDNIKMA